MKLIEYIRLGIQAKSFFPYDDYMIPLRPLTTTEFDLSEDIAFDKISNGLARLIMLIRLDDIKLTDELRNMDGSLYKDIQHFYNKIDYNIVFHSMKDFQPEDFTLHDVEKMHSIHEIAKFIIDISNAKEELVIDEVSSVDGQRLATIIYRLNQPLVSDAWKLTPLQHKFLLWSHPDAPKKVADSWEEFVKKRQNGEILQNVSK